MLKKERKADKGGKREKLKNVRKGREKDRPPAPPPPPLVPRPLPHPEKRETKLTKICGRQQRKVNKHKKKIAEKSGQIQ